MALVAKGYLSTKKALFRATNIYFKGTNNSPVLEMGVRLERVGVQKTFYSNITLLGKLGLVVV